MVLYEAGLVDRRRDGKWAYFKLAGCDSPTHVTQTTHTAQATHVMQISQAIAWVIESLGDAPQTKADAKKLNRVLKKDPKELCRCYA